MRSLPPTVLNHWKMRIGKRHVFKSVVILTFCSLRESLRANGNTFFFLGTNQVSVILSLSGMYCYSLVKYKLVFILRHFRNNSHYFILYMCSWLYHKLHILNYQVILHSI